MAEQRFKIRMIACLASTLVSGCFVPEDDVLGRWQSVDEIGGYHNEFVLDENPAGVIRGRGHVFFRYAGLEGVYVDEFDAMVYVLEEDKKYEIDMICDREDADCEDFMLRCAVYENGAVMDCVGDGVFENYENFTYVRPST